MYVLLHLFLFEISQNLGVLEGVDEDTTWVFVGAEEFVEFERYIG